MGNTEIAIIINSYNRLELLKKSISSIVAELSKSPLKAAIVIFDANSSDGSIEWIGNFILQNKSTSIHLHLIQASGNERDSFSYGVNSCCEYAIQKYSSLKYLLLYETDNFLSSSEPLLKARRMLDENTPLAACGFTVKKHNGSSAGFGSSLPTILSLLLGQQFSFALKLSDPKVRWLKNDYCEYGYSDVVYTSPLLLKKESWLLINGFDYKNFPFSDCDIDLAYRLKKAGKKMAVLKTRHVIHDNLEIQSSWSATRTLNFHKARLHYFLKHKGRLIHLTKPFLWFMHLLEFLFILCMVFSGKRKRHSLKTRWLLMKSVFFNYQLNPDSRNHG